MSAGWQLSDDQMTAAPRRMAREVLTGGNLDVIDDILDPDFVDHNALPGAAPGREGFKQTVALLRTAFPDLAVTPQAYVVEGDMVVEHTESLGTHDGPFFGLPATHVPVWISAIVMARVTREGKMVERWGQFNLFELLQQVGIVPGGTAATKPAATPPVVTESAPATPEDNKAVFTRYVDGVWNRADQSVADEVLHPQAIMPYNPQPTVGPAGTMAWVGFLRAALPDLRVTVEGVVGDGTRVCGRMLLEGTHDGVFFGVPPTGRRLSIGQMTLVRIAGGRIVSTWLETDLAGAMQQLGVMPGGG